MSHMIAVFISFFHNSQKINRGATCKKKKVIFGGVNSREESLN